MQCHPFPSGKTPLLSGKPEIRSMCKDSTGLSPYFSPVPCRSAHDILIKTQKFILNAFKKIERRKSNLFLHKELRDWVTHLCVVKSELLSLKTRRQKGKRGTRWLEEEALVMYLHFYGNGLGQTWLWSSVVRGTWGQVLSSWSEAAAAAICREWGGTREQTPKAPKLAINRNQELVGFSPSMSSKSYDSLVMRTCKWAPLSISPSL